MAGWLLSSAAWVGLYGSAALWLAVTALIIEAKGFIGFVFALGMFGLFYVTVFPTMVRLILRGRKMRSPRANDILSGQSRPPVVLLRSFEDDDLIDPSFPTTSQIAPGRYEERLAKALSAVGPSVALGPAGRNLTGEEWQQFFIDEPYSPICPDLPSPKDCGKKAKVG